MEDAISLLPEPSESLSARPAWDWCASHGLFLSITCDMTTMMNGSQLCSEIGCFFFLSITLPPIPVWEEAVLRKYTTWKLVQVQGCNPEPAQPDACVTERRGRRTAKAAKQWEEQSHKKCLRDTQNVIENNFWPPGFVVSVKLITECEGWIF